MRPRSFLFILPIFAGLCAQAEDFQGATHPILYDEETIFYSKATAGGPVAELQEKLDQGEVRLEFDNDHGYLPALLKYFGIPKSSQMLVFSKTSVQRALITPATPRALYFNDDVYIGYVPGAPMLEISAVDPKLGGVFYHLDQEKLRHPKFVQDAACLQCHSGPRTMGVPGHVLRSVGTDPDGEPRSGEEVSTVDQCTPLSERWGGWYVTGNLGAQMHRGNLVTGKPAEPPTEPANPDANLRDLHSLVDVAPYLEPGSDVVALMVLEHQAKMHNYITRLNYETRIMLERYQHIRYLKEQETAFLRYLLMTEEARLTEPVSGTSSYATDFPKMGPRDRLGRSLRDFDLRTRLFKYPCSFLVYDPAFDAMPEPMHADLLQRLYNILTGQDSSREWAGLSPEDREAVLQILRDTKPNLPEYWRAE